MTELDNVLSEYDRNCFHKDSQQHRLEFDSEEERFLFILRVNKIGGVEYYLYGCYKVDVFL